ncbi:hypothetical protein NON00_17695 [Roseomonas sp. GC11]|uniref:hypothetical protein n=1 Tax=Roseomonas sp. GC11 TaxID=2950546 RepID=UPI002109C9DD|nr:hypothetical protein [Roseomonas sp. GC11]MCQ4161751.1 hypothetical protein [Roseomonas sp. GC11]
MMQEKMFFFEKKNQKTSFSLRPAVPGDGGSLKESLFASFSSEKEDSILEFS